MVTHLMQRDFSKAEHLATPATSSTINKVCCAVLSCYNIAIHSIQREQKTSLGTTDEDVLFLAAMAASSAMMKEEEKQKELLRANEIDLELSRRAVKHLTYCLMESKREVN